MRIAVVILAFLFVHAALVEAQLPPDEALVRLKARQAKAGAASQPATLPSGATRPASLKDAHRIVFLVDTQVPHVRLPYLQDELNLAVEHLREDQFFTIIVLAVQYQAPKEFNPNPIRATATAKSAAKDFINAIQDDRKTNPLPSIRNAVALDPDLLYFIVEDNTTQSEQVRRAFDSLHGRLNILLFSGFMAHPDEFLRTLAIEHGGKAIDQHGDELEPPKPKSVLIVKPASRPSLLEK
jgi:hypothetical protein